MRAAASARVGAPRAALHRPRRAPRPARRPGRSQRCSSAPTAPTPARTARPTCSSSAASRRATTRPCRGCSARAAGRPGSRPTATASALDLGDEVVVSRPRGRGAAARAPLHRPDARRPPARASCSSPACPPLLPEWAYGHWKSRDVYDHQREAEDDFEGYREHGIPLDAIVLDSPWATQYNTWEFNPHQFPDLAGMVRRLRAGGVRTVVWVTPWVNLDSRDGQHPPDAESAAPAPRAAPNYAEGAAAATSSATRTASRSSRAGGWAPARRSTSPRPPPRSGGASRPSACSSSGVEGIKADDGEGWYIPDDARFADGTHRRAGGVGPRLKYRRSMQRALDEVHPGRGVLFGRPRLDRPAGGRRHLGRRPGVATSGRCGRSSPPR